jgi:hypothetical protein
MALLEIIPIRPHPRAALGILIDRAAIEVASPAGVADWEALQRGRGDAWRDAIAGVWDREREGRAVVWVVERRGLVVEGHAGEVRLLVSLAGAWVGFDGGGMATRRDLARSAHLSLLLRWMERGWRGRERRCRIMPR